MDAGRPRADNRAASTHSTRLDLRSSVPGARLRFPGPRNPKHYFPISRKTTRVEEAPGAHERGSYIVGLDEVLVDVEVRGAPSLAEELGLVPGESVQLPPAAFERVVSRLPQEGATYAVGGTVANTLNNYTHLSGEPAVLLGAIEDRIPPGSPAFAYVAQTPKAVDLRHLMPVRGATGTAITFITPDGDRAFGVHPGVAGDYPASAVPEDAVRSAAVVLTSLYCLRPEDRPIAGAALRMMELATAAGVPVAFGLGTAALVRERRAQVRELLDAWVTVAAMNAQEAEALTGESDALLAGRAALQWVDLAVITEGSRGLTLCGYTCERVRRETREEVRSKAIPEYNRWEFSRLLRRADCERPQEVYSHIHTLSSLIPTTSFSWGASRFRSDSANASAVSRANRT